MEMSIHLKLLPGEIILGLSRSNHTPTPHKITDYTLMVMLVCLFPSQNADGIYMKLFHVEIICDQVQTTPLVQNNLHTDGDDI